MGSTIIVGELIDTELSSLGEAAGELQALHRLLFVAISQYL